MNIAVCESCQLHLLIGVSITNNQPTEKNILITVTCHFANLLFLFQATTHISMATRPHYQRD